MNQPTYKVEVQDEGKLINISYPQTPSTNDFSAQELLDLMSLMDRVTLAMDTKEA